MNRKISFDSVLDTIIDKNSISKVFARKLLNEMAAIIQQGLLRDNVVNLSGMGIFKLHSVPARPGRNIQTGEAITIPAHRKVLFKPEKHLRELINKKYVDLSPQILGELVQKPQVTQPAKESSAKGDPTKPAFFTEAFDTFKEEKELSESPKIEKIEKKELPVEKTDNESNTVLSGDKSNRKLAPVLYSILALLIIIFLFMQFSEDETESGPIVTEQQTPAEQSNVESEISQKQQKAEKPPPAQKVFKFETYAAQSGDNLWNLAYENYNDGYLWPLILQANSSKITNPDLIAPGVDLKIPIVQEVNKLSAAENNNLAKGHILAYLAYKKQNNAEALNHLFVANKYDPEYVKSSQVKIDKTDLESVKNISLGTNR